MEKLQDGSSQQQRSRQKKVSCRAAAAEASIAVRSIRVCMSWRQLHLRGGLTFTQQHQPLISRVMVAAATWGGWSWSRVSGRLMEGIGADLCGGGVVSLVISS